MASRPVGPRPPRRPHRRLPCRARGAAPLAALVLGASLGCGSDTPQDPQQDPLGAPRSAAPDPAQESSPWASGALDAAPAAPPPPLPTEWLPDEAAARGLTYVNHSGGPEKAFILEANGAGVALLDLESDGDLDVVFAQGLPTFDALRSGPGADLEVFRNDGTGCFTPWPGPGLSGWWTGLAAGDLDGDGDTDLVAGGFGGLAVLEQVAGGKLMPVEHLVPPARRLEPGAPREAGHPPDWVTSLALADFDGDGRLDLYAGRYLDLDPLTPPAGALGEGPLAVPCSWRGQPVYCGPRGLVAQPDALFLGRARGATGPWFRDVSATHLPAVQAGYTLGVLACDPDDDGDVDLFVANDSAPNLLLVNDGRGVFVDHGYAAGVALGPDGQMEAGMGVAAGDVDGDGRVDLAVTNFSDEPTRLLLAAEVGFRDATHRTGLGRATRALLSWGVHLVDLDGDGGLELFTANGHVHPAADAPHTGTSYGQPDTLWSIGRDGRVTLRAPETPRSLLAPASGSRGSAVGDVDGDGRPDLVVVRLDGPAALGMNRFEGHTWLELCLEGTTSPRDGNGAVVHLAAGGRRQRGEVMTSGSFQSSSSPRLHFGLGRAVGYDALVVRWPSGHVEELGAGAGGRRIWLREGAGIVREEALGARSAPSVAMGAHAPDGAPAAGTVGAGYGSASVGVPGAGLAADLAGDRERGSDVARQPGPGAVLRPGMPAESEDELRERWAQLLAAGEPGAILREAAAGSDAPAGPTAWSPAQAALLARALHATGEGDAGRAALAAARARLAESERVGSAAARELDLAEASLALEDDALERCLELVLGPGARPGAPVRHPEEPLAWLVAGRALARRDAGRATDTASHAAEPYLVRFVELAPLHPEAPSALHLLARIALDGRDGARAAALRAEAERRGRWHEVFRARLDARRRAPHAPEPRLALAELWRAVGRTDRARAELDALLALHPDHAEARARLAALGKE
jgi:hypothetical protein